MINIDKFRTFFMNVANKSGRGTITPAQFNSFVEQGVQSFYNKRVGVRDSNGLPMSLKDINQMNMENLDDLKLSIPLLSTLGDVLIPNGTTYDLNGLIAPKYWTFGSLGFNYHYAKDNSVEERPIEIVKENDWLKRTSSTITAPTLKYPIARFLGGKIQVRPKSLSKVHLTYYRYPNTPKWAYIIVNSRPQYDSVNSVDIEANEDAFNEIAMLCLGYLGINLREQDLFQYANATENK